MDADTIRQRLQELAFLNSAATIHFTVRDRGSKDSSKAGSSETGERLEGGIVSQETMHHSGGLQEYVTHLNHKRQPLHDRPVYTTQTVCCP